MPRLLPILLLLLPAAAASQPRTAHVAMEKGRPTLFVDGRPMTPMFYALTDVPSGRWTWEEIPQHNLRRFCEQGVRLFQLGLFFEHVWMEDGTLDLTLARKQLAGLREACPDGVAVLRFHLHAPRWWRDQHPEEWVRYADTDYFDEDFYGSLMRIISYDVMPVRRVSLASTRYREEASVKLKAFLEALAATPEADNLIGIHLADGVYGEWHYWGFYYHEPDVGGPMTQAYRDWLRRTYGTEDRLREAWNDPGASFDAAVVPDTVRRRTTAGVFRDPMREQPVIDYYRAQHAVVADALLHYARIVRETWPRPLVIGAFFGYYFSTFGRQAAGCHLEMLRVFDSPYIDYVSSPNAYEPEANKLGDPYHSRGLLTTVRLHGKLWLDENDTEPTVPIKREDGREIKLRNSLANDRRNTLFTAVQGMGLWYFDFGAGGADLDNYRHNYYGSRGTWDHDSVLANIGRLKQVIDRKRQAPFQSSSDVLFVYDTEAYYHTASLKNADPVSRTMEDYLPLAAWRSGVAFETIHLQDLERIDLSPYRVVVFGNTFVLDDRQRRFIRDHVAADGRTLVWTYAPGYSDGRRLDPDAVSRLTGFRLAPLTLQDIPEITLALPDSTFTYRVGDRPFGPLFAVDDPEAEVLGRYTATGQAAVARKRFEDHTAWYVALPGKVVEPLRHILRTSGAHVYSPQGDVVYTGDGLVVVHGKSGGRREVVLRNGRTRTFDLPEETAFTLVLDADTGEALLPP